jgi:hypothetical protein
MTKAEELLSHAARCNCLAEIFLDRAVAEKLRQLAQDYWELAGQPSQHYEGCGSAAQPGPRVRAHLPGQMFFPTSRESASMPS